MYQAFMVRNFRCFRELTITDLKLVNLIAGINNIGKTALLEAVFLHCGAYNPALTLRLNAFRGIETFKLDSTWWTDNPWDSLFHQFDTTKTIELMGTEGSPARRRILRLRVLREAAELAMAERIIAREASGQQNTSGLREAPKSLDTSKTPKVLQLEYRENKRSSSYYMVLDQAGLRVEPIPPGPPFPAFFQGARMRAPFKEEAEYFGKLELSGEHEVVLNVLQLLEPKLRRLAVVVVAGEPILHGDIGTGRLMPLPVMGEGMVRLASLVIRIGNAAGGVVLIDEVENGLHHSVLPKVWRAIGEGAARFNCQVIATTHSLECVAAAHKAFAESGRYDFRLHRLERVNETPRVVTYDQEALEAAIETGLEVR